VHNGWQSSSSSPTRTFPPCRKISRATTLLPTLASSQNHREYRVVAGGRTTSSPHSTNSLVNYSGKQVEENTLSTWIIALSSISLSDVQLESFKVKAGSGLNSNCLKLWSAALCQEIQASCGGTSYQLHLHLQYLSDQG
jgi:hypothetical protein